MSDQEQTTAKKSPNSFISKLGSLKDKLNQKFNKSLKVATPMRQPRIGLALGCGGAKALVHMGVIKAFEENDIPIHAIAGCSMGAYVGALWATGHDSKQMIAIASEFKDKESFKKLADPAVPPIKGLFHGNRLKSHLEGFISDPQIQDLDRDFIAIAANLDNYQRVVFNSGSLLDAVHASCAMPGIIVPVTVNGIRCVDGGVVDPVPVGSLRDYLDVDIIIAVSTTPELSDIEAAEPVITIEEVAPTNEGDSWLRTKINSIGKKYNPAAKGNMLDTLRRSLKASQIRIAHDACMRADLALHPITEETAWHQYEKFAHFIEVGEKTTLVAMPEIKKLLEPIPDIKDESEENDGK